jgi:hypothetical protein
VLSLTEAFSVSLEACRDKNTQQTKADFKQMMTSVEAQRLTRECTELNLQLIVAREDHTAIAHDIVFTKSRLDRLELDTDNQSSPRFSQAKMLRSSKKVCI